MSRKVFTAGEVLAAADVNNFLMNQTVMSFAGTASRAASIPVPIEGMYTHLEDTDQLQFWNGSAWRSPNDLVLVKSQVMGTAVASVTVNDAFNATYDDYLIIISGGNASTNSNLSFQLGSVVTGYYESGFRSAYASPSLVAEGAANTSPFSRVARCSSTVISTSFQVLQPFASERTTVIYGGSGQTAGDFMWFGSGFLDNTISFTAFTLTPNVGTLTGARINIYGYRKTI